MSSWKKVLSMAVIGALLWLSPKISAQEIDPYFYLTPLKNYSRIGKSLAIRYEAQLWELANNILSQIPSERFKLFDQQESPMAGVGFWLNPEIFVPEARFLGVCARVNIKLNYFPDNQWGRFLDAMDAFGKDLLRLQGEALNNILDHSVKGAVLVLIYSKAELNDPRYYEQAEAMVLFIPREVLKKFNRFQIRYSQLFEQSTIYYFQGPHQIQVLLNEFIRG